MKRIFVPIVIGLLIYGIYQLSFYDWQLYGMPGVSASIKDSKNRNIFVKSVTLKQVKAYRPEASKLKMKEAWVERSWVFEIDSRKSFADDTTKTNLVILTVEHKDSTLFCDNKQVYQNCICFVVVDEDGLTYVPTKLVEVKGDSTYMYNSPSSYYKPENNKLFLYRVSKGEIPYKDMFKEEIAEYEVR